MDEGSCQGGAGPGFQKGHARGTVDAGEQQQQLQAGSDAGTYLLSLPVNGCCFCAEGLLHVTQVIEFPNFLQRVHKLYVDWDKKLSEVQAKTQFLTPSSSSCAVQRNASVQQIRQLALRTPCAIMKLLKRAGGTFDAHVSEVKVLVKEGTRKIASADGSDEDWKISFHFVFQVLIFLEAHLCGMHAYAEHVGGTDHHDVHAIQGRLRPHGRGHPKVSGPPQPCSGPEPGG